MATATQPHSIQFHGLGLLTTVASLPPKYRSRYLYKKTKCEIPLDLSVKPTVPQIANDVPNATTFTEVHTEAVTTATATATETETATAAATSTCMSTTMAAATATATATTTAMSDIDAKRTITEIATEAATETAVLPAQFEETAQMIVQQEVVVVTTADIPTPLSPAKRKFAKLSDSVVEQVQSVAEHLPKMAKTSTHPATNRDVTPIKLIKGNADAAPRTSKATTPSTKLTRNKATRKLKFDEETSSPVSGTIIRPLEDIADGSVQYSNGDIDPKYNIVEITEETKAELAAIKNVIGDYVCKLCRIKFDDAFGLARHRCACIVLLEYRCPECGKQFNCPANLASHRRWHKPKKDVATTTATTATTATRATTETAITVAKKENRNTINQQAVPLLSAAKKVEHFSFECEECGKKFKRQAYLRKHQQTHINKTTGSRTKTNVTATKAAATATITTTKAMATTSAAVTAAESTASSATTIVGTFQTTHYVSSNSCASSVSSTHSYGGTTHEDEGVCVSSSGTNAYDYDPDYLSDCSSTSSSTGYGRLQIVEHGLTEEESIAAAALTNLRNCASVIQHTTMAH